MTPRRSLRTVAVAAACAAWVAALVAGCTSSPGDGTPPPAPTAPASEAAPSPPLGRADAARLETDLTSSDAAVRRSAVARGVRDAGGPDAAVLPSGSTLAIDESGAVLGTDIASGTAEVPATVAGPRPAAWTLLLVHEDDRWTLYGSRPR